MSKRILVSVAHFCRQHTTQTFSFFENEVRVSRKEVSLKALQHTFKNDRPLGSLIRFNNAVKNRLLNESPESFEKFIAFLCSTLRSSKSPVRFKVIESVFNGMIQLNIKPTVNSMEVMINECALVGSVLKTEEYFEVCKRLGIQLSENFITKMRLISAMKSGDLESGTQHFQTLLKLEPNLPDPYIQFMLSNLLNPEIPKITELMEFASPFRFRLYREDYFPLLKYFQNANKPDEIIKLKQKVFKLTKYDPTGKESHRIENLMLWAYTQVNPREAKKFHDTIRSWTGPTYSLALENATRVKYPPSKVTYYFKKLNALQSPKQTYVHLAPALVKAYDVTLPYSLIEILMSFEPMRKDKDWTELCFAVLKSFVMNGDLTSMKQLWEFLHNREIQLDDHRFRSLCAVKYGEYNQELCDRGLEVYKYFLPYLPESDFKSNPSFLVTRMILEAWKCGCTDGIRKLVHEFEGKVHLNTENVVFISEWVGGDEQIWDIIQPIL